MEIMNIFDDIFSDPQYDQLNKMVRWNGANRQNDESVSQHSFIVSWFTRVIVEELYPNQEDRFKLDCTTYAIFHDFDEMFSGDVIHGVKYNPVNGEEIRKLLDQFIHSKVEDKFGGSEDPSRIMLRSLLLDKQQTGVKEVVKLSDWLSMAYYIKQEILLGNVCFFEEWDYCSVNIRVAVQNCLKALSNREVDFNSKILTDISNLNFSKYGRGR